MTTIIGRSYGASVAFPVWEVILVSIASRTLHGLQGAQLFQESAESERQKSVATYALYRAYIVPLRHCECANMIIITLYSTMTRRENPCSAQYDWLTGDLHRHVAAMLLRDTGVIGHRVLGNL